MKCFWLVSLLTISLASQTQAEVIRTFQVGHWNAAAYSTDGGSFSHCAAGMKFRSNITMLFSINKSFVWTIALNNPEWTFDRGQHVGLTLAIDKASPTKMEAEAFSRSGILITLPDDADLFRGFRTARRIKVSGARQTFEFEMNRMDEMLTKLLACVKQYNGPSGTPAVARNPFITTKKGGDEIAAEATAFAANLLSDAKISGYRFLQAGELPKLDGDARWIVPGSGLGSIRIFPDIGMDAQKSLARQVIARETRACEGKFVSGVMPDDEKGSGGAFCHLRRRQNDVYFLLLQHATRCRRGLSSHDRLLRREGGG